jgi:tight adherence protein B
MTLRVVGVLLGVALVGVLAREARRADPRRRVRDLTGAWMLPGWCRPVIVAWLERADVDLTPEAALGWWATGVLAIGWLAALSVPALVVPAVLVGLAAGPVSLHTRAGHADRRVRAALPDLLDQVVAHIRAGSTVTEALRNLADRPGALAPDLRRISRRLDLGAPLDSALATWADERRAAGVRAAAGALALVTSVGGAAAGPLEGLATSMRADDAAAGEARALSSQARVSAIVVGLAPLGYLAFATTADPASARALVATTPGRICLVLGLMLEAIATWWMRALVRSA